jgi:hypothetical protein
MKLFLKKFLNCDLVVRLRNTFNIRPQIYNKNIDSFSSVSDAFAWRTDGSFKTVFSYSDLLNIFYNIDNSYVEICFYSKHNILLKKIKINKLKLSNKLVIDSNFFNGLKDYGVFYIFHHSNNESLKEEIISNRCYTGYSHNNNLYSFVHGNVFASYFVNDSGIIGGDIIKTSFIKNQIYKIQKYFDNVDKLELFISNPTTKKIYFSINDSNYTLNKGCSEILDVKTNIKSIILKSNCTYLRPIIFNYKDDFLDVHHS